MYSRKAGFTGPFWGFNVSEENASGVQSGVNDTSKKARKRIPKHF
jgi:hypothetical protein